MNKIVLFVGVAGLLLIGLENLSSSKAKVWREKARAFQALSDSSGNLTRTITVALLILLVAVGIGKIGLEAEAKNGKYSIRMSEAVPAPDRELITGKDRITEADLDRYYMEKQETYLKSEKKKNTTSAPKTTKLGLLGVIPEADSGSFFGEGGLFEKAEESIENIIGLDGNFHQVKKN